MLTKCGDDDDDCEIYMLYFCEVKNVTFINHRHSVSAVELIHITRFARGALYSSPGRVLVFSNQKAIKLGGWSSQLHFTPSLINRIPFRALYSALCTCHTNG
jgi:hypothetical protein